MWLAKINHKLLIIFLLALFLRLFKLESYPVSLNWDEVAIGYNAYSISQTGKDEYGTKFPLLFKSFNDYKLPGYIYLDAMFIKVLGLNEFSVRLPSALFGAAAVPIFFLITKRLLESPQAESLKISKNTPLIAAALLTISPWHIQFSRAAFEANVALTILLFGILSLILGLRNKLFALLSIPALIISIYFYYTERLIVPILIISFLLVFKQNVLKHLKQYLIGLTIGIFLAAPITINFLKPEGIKRVSEVSILSDQTIYSETVFANSQINNMLTSIFLNYKTPLSLEFLHNYFSHFSPGFLFFSDDPNPRQKIPLTGNLYLFEIITLSIGFWQLLKIKNKSTKFFILFWLLITPIASSLAKESPHSLRALPMVAPVLIISALGFQKLLTNNLFKISILTAMLVSLIGYLVNYYYLYPVQNSTSWGYGYKQLFMKLNEQENSYDKIIVTGANWKPYIYYLFYNKINPSLYIRSQNTVESDSTDECESEYILPRTGSILLAHVNLKCNTEAFQASEVYQKIESQTTIGKYVFGPTPWDNNGMETDDNFINASKGSKTLLVLSPQEVDSLKDKTRLKKTSEIRDYSNRYVIYEIGQWQ